MVNIWAVLIWLQHPVSVRHSAITFISMQSLKYISCGRAEQVKVLLLHNKMTWLKHMQPKRDRGFKPQCEKLPLFEGCVMLYPVFLELTQKPCSEKMITTASNCSADADRAELWQMLHSDSTKQTGKVWHVFLFKVMHLLHHLASAQHLEPLHGSSASQGRHGLTCEQKHKMHHWMF